MGGDRTAYTAVRTRYRRKQLLLIILSLINLYRSDDNQLNKRNHGLHTVIPELISMWALYARGGCIIRRRFVLHVGFRIVCVASLLQISGKLSIKALIKSVNNTLAMRKWPHFGGLCLGGTGRERLSLCVQMF